MEWTLVASTAEDLMMLPCPATPLEMLGCLAQECHPLLQSIHLSVMIHHIYITQYQGLLENQPTG